MDFTSSDLESLDATDDTTEFQAAGVNTACDPDSLSENVDVDKGVLNTEFVEAPFLIFRLGTSWFGVPSLVVREIHALPALSQLQETASFIVGVLNLRGAIVPVMDLNARFGQSAVPYRLDDSLVVLSWGGEDVAILVNEVRAVERISAKQIEAAPAHGRPRDLPAPFVAGVTQIGDGIVMLLHLPHLLNWPVSYENSDSSAVAVGITAPRFDLQAWTPAELAVLEERAALLRPTEDDIASDGNRAPVALISLGGEEFGIELSVVREFVSVSAVAPVPCCPPHILGQINLRGAIVTLVDVRPTLRTSRTSPAYFDGAQRVPPTTVPITMSVVVVQHEGAPVGIVVDNVRDVLYLREDERLTLDANIQNSGHNGRYFTGGALKDGRLVPLLDVVRLFAEGNLDVDEGA